MGRPHLSCDEDSSDQHFSKNENEDDDDDDQDDDEEDEDNDDDDDEEEEDDKLVAGVPAHCDSSLIKLSIQTMLYFSLAHHFWS